jgi:hypothetical protein
MAANSADVTEKRSAVAKVEVMDAWTVDAMVEEKGERTVWRPAARKGCPLVGGTA